MKPAKKILIAQLFLLMTAGYTFNGCSGGNNQPSAENTPKPVISNAEEKEETEASETKSEAKGEVFEHWENNKGIGPVKSLTIPPEIDKAMAAEGEEIYKAKCTSCHKPNQRFIGPNQKGVLDRRTPEWVMNMILNPEQMVKEDPIAKQLLVDYNLSPMANQNLTEDQARKVLEYIRTF